MNCSSNRCKMENVLKRFNFGLIFFNYIIFANAESVMKLIKGEKADFDFPYECNSTEITLQYSYKDPFYRTINPQSLPLARYPESRFVIENKRERHNCSIHLTIKPVHRSDAGTYTTQEYKDGDLLPKYTVIGLNVAYPPGKASCALREGSRVGDWGLLGCTAPIGNLRGQVECYQRGERLPPYSTPAENREKLDQTIWVRLSHPVFCCSSALDLAPTDQCDCQDFIFDPSDGYRRSQRSAIDPCPSTTTLQVSTKHMPSTDERETNTLSSPTNLPGEHHRTTDGIKGTVLSLMKWVYVIVAGLIVLIVLCLATFIKLCHMSPKTKQDYA